MRSQISKIGHEEAQKAQNLEPTANKEFGLSFINHYVHFVPFCG